MCAVEAKRGCGYRKVGGLYLVGTGLAISCDRLPLEVPVCPVCGETIRQTRGIQRIDPLRLFGPHLVQRTVHGMDEPDMDCGCPAKKYASCPVCEPGDKAWLMWVGSEYTPEGFIEEAQRLGISKRIHQVPKDLEIGKDWVWLAYWRLIPGKGQYVMFGEKDLAVKENEKGPGIFYVFRPTHLEKIVTHSQFDSMSDEEKKEYEDKGVRLVPVPDDDPDHNPRKGGRNDDEGET